MCAVSFTSSPHIRVGGGRRTCTAQWRDPWPSHRCWVHLYGSRSWISTADFTSVPLLWPTEAYRPLRHNAVQYVIPLILDLGVFTGTGKVDFDEWLSMYQRITNSYRKAACCC
nr:uncharacterized protein LOC119175567 isoform X1 [Rhipicephalus microplus]